MRRIAYVKVAHTKDTTFPLEGTPVHAPVVALLVGDLSGGGFKHVSEASRLKGIRQCMEAVATAFPIGGWLIYHTEGDRVSWATSADELLAQTTAEDGHYSTFIVSLGEYVPAEEES